MTLVESIVEEGRRRRRKTLKMVHDVTRIRINNSSRCTRPTDRQNAGSVTIMGRIALSKSDYGTEIKRKISINKYLRFGQITKLVIGS